MDIRRTFSTVTLLLLLVACSGDSRPLPSLQTPRTNASSSLAPEAPSTATTSLPGRIVFDDGYDVWSIDADGTDLSQLTNAPWPEFDPSWSPDGTQIAYRSEPDGDQEIWLMDPDGSHQRRLTRGLSPVWSPDGTQIAYASPGEILCPPGRGIRCTGISIMNADGSKQHRVPNTDGGEYPSWSPDGKRIVFNSNLSGEHLMSIVNVDGTGLVDLSEVGDGWQVDWSPDGRSILFSSHRDHSDYYADIYVMRPDGSGVQRLTNKRADHPSWSPDGSHVVFAAPGGLFVMRPDGSNITPLPVDGMAVLPDWL